MWAVMVGLDCAGKTTIIYQLKAPDHVRTIPNIGFDVEKLKLDGLDCTVWDVGGQEKLRPLWKHYLQSAQGLIFVIDSTDVERLGEATSELHRLLREPELENVKLLVFANKQDLPGALSPQQLINELDLCSITQTTRFVQPCCALTGDGIMEGFEFLKNDTLPLPTRTKSAHNTHSCK